MDLSEQAKKKKKKVAILESHVDVCLRVTSAEEEYNNQVDKITYSMHTSQPLSQATSVIAPQVYEKSDCGGRDEGYGQAQQHGFPLTEADLVTVTDECSVCQQWRSTLTPQYDTNLW